MPDLFHSLQGRDLGFLRNVANLWGIELKAPDVHTALPALVEALSDRQLVEEVVEALPGEVQAALGALLQNEGRLPYAVFSRRFGSIREMGAARRERQRPHLTPTSPAEWLWYRALISRAFFATPTEPQEFAFIPDDLLALLPGLPGEAPQPPGRPATPGECGHPLPASERILDHACSLLAALRLGWKASEIPASGWEMLPAALQTLLADAGLLDAHGLPLPEATRAFLEAGRGEALALLARAWLESRDFNELRLLPGLAFEGEWKNDPLRTRRFLLDVLASLPAGTWWNLPALIADLRERHPDFQRPAGDYDSWFIRRESDGEFLRGFAHWEEVDGALIRFCVCGPLHWLGIVDLAAAEAQATPNAFRRSAWGEALLRGEAPQGLPAEDAPLRVFPGGRLRIPARAPRSVRYQIARACQWGEETPEEYGYRLTPASLERARKQGLRVSHLLSLLRRYASAPPTPSLVQALERWELNGAQARLEEATVLRLGSPEMLEALRRSRAARFLGDPLGPTAVIIKPGSREKVVAALIEMGYLPEARPDDDASGV